MTHFINNSEFEIIEQKLINNWVVRNFDTGESREISDYYLRNIHQYDYEEKSREIVA